MWFVYPLKKKDWTHGMDSCHIFTSIKKQLKIEEVGMAQDQKVYKQEW